MLWIQNMSEVFECKSPQKLFLQFKGEEYSAGLQFVNETEAQHMVDLIRKVIDKQSALKKEITFKQKVKQKKIKIMNILSQKWCHYSEGHSRKGSESCSDVQVNQRK